ncbi:MAG: hypothetical protein K9N51_00355 [Candidatus Pacebacteria bacterium]|nr:hypothetical protein [Candidatus Paceibacterota bacterium]
MSRRKPISIPRISFSGHQVSSQVFALVVMTALCLHLPGSAAEPPAAPEYRTYTQTDLVRDGQSTCIVVYPSTPPLYQELAKNIQSAIQTQTQVAPEIRTDTEVTEKHHPVLLEPYRDRNLILLGRLGINRAIWGPYNHFKCAVDGYYPGGNDGYVVRTAANVYGNGANTIIVGGSTDAGAQCAVDRFLKILDESPVDDQRFVLPWLLDVRLGGRCKTEFDQDDITPSPDQGGRPRAESVHFYTNAMNYYWSGRKIYLEHARRTLAMILERMKDDGQISSEYGMEFFVRAYDMLDDSGLFTPEDIAATDRAIIHSFKSYGDGKQAKFQSQLKDQRKSYPWLADHNTASNLADKVMADFILQNLPAALVPEELRQTAYTRRQLYVEAYDKLILERWRACSSGSNMTDVATMNLFRYALEMERYKRFFDSNNARMAALYHLARTRNPDGEDMGLAFGRTSGTTEWRLFMGIAASYYQDPELRAVMDAIHRRGRIHFDVHVNGVHTYEPGEELPTRKPDSLLGATIVPFTPGYYRHSIKNLGLAKDETFNLATIRGGFEKEDYLLLSGGQDLLPNTLIQFVSNGQAWLSHTPKILSFHQNALEVQCLSDTTESEASSPAARLEHCLNAPGAAFLSSTVPTYHGTQWNRRILWLKQRFFIVFDRVTPTQKGDYMIMANWRTGRGELIANRWVRKTGETTFVIAPATKSTALSDIDVDPTTGSKTAVLRQRIEKTMKPGDVVEFVNLMFTCPAESNTDYAIRRHPSGCFLVRNGETKTISLVGNLPEELGDSDAAMLIVTPDELVCFAARKLTFRGNEFVNDQTPRTTLINLDDQSAIVRETLRQYWTNASSIPASEKLAGTIPRDQARVERIWRYGGAQRPGLIPDPIKLHNSTWDLGRVALLTEITARSGKLPDKISVRASDNEHWQHFDGERHYMGIVTMANYGRIRLKEEGYQTVHRKPIQARYVKFEGEHMDPSPANSWPPQFPPFLFYDANRLTTSDPVTAVPVALRGGKQTDIMIVPDLWPGFRNQNHRRHDLIVLDADGNERWHREIQWRMFFTPRALDWDGTGCQHVFVGSFDYNLYVYDADGNLVRTLTVADAENRPGFPLPNGVGVWQPDDKGRRKIVMPRYNNFSFFNRDGSVEGHARCGGRGGGWYNDILKYGIDFDGNGIEDTAAMHAYALMPVTQATVGSRVSSPGLPRRERTVSGSPTLAFELFAPGKPKLFIARKNMIGMYDLKTGTWTAVWKPKIPLTAAVALPEKNQILCSSQDQILWRIQLDENHAIALRQRIPVVCEIRRMTHVDGWPGEALAATDSGLLRIAADNSVTKLAEGDFGDVAALPLERRIRMIGVTPDGRVEAYDIHATSN